MHTWMVARAVPTSPCNTDWLPVFLPAARLPVTA